MTPCARGCCWTPTNVCAQQRTCPCHWSEATPRAEPRTSDAAPHADPTARRAIANVMRARTRNPKRPRI